MNRLYLLFIQSLYTFKTPSCFCLNNSVRWPRGTYALPMPVTGCPQSRKLSWSKGHVRQNTEDTRPLSNWSRPVHLKGFRKNNVITQHFCVKENREGTRDWPRGKYCIYKKGKCPNGKNACILDSQVVYFCCFKNQNQNNLTLKQV